MINITLPDDSVRQFSQPVTVHDVAKDIGEGLARATLAGEVDGELVAAPPDWLHKRSRPGFTKSPPPDAVPAPAAFPPAALPAPPRAASARETRSSTSSRGGT